MSRTKGGRKEPPGRQFVEGTSSTGGMNRAVAACVHAAPTICSASTPSRSCGLWCRAGYAPADPNRLKNNVPLVYRELGGSEIWGSLAMSSDRDAHTRPQHRVEHPGSRTVAPDGRFLMNVAAEDAAGAPITVVLNWQAGLKK